MLGKRKNKYSSGRHRILVVSVLCLFGFCLLAQVRPAKKGEQKPAKSKVYLLYYRSFRYQYHLIPAYCQKYHF